MQNDMYANKFNRMMGIVRVIEQKDRYDELHGKINRKNLAQMIGVSERTVDRYIDVLKNVLDYPIVYDPDNQTYEMFMDASDRLKNQLSKNEIILLLMILDSSKSFNGIEILDLKEKLISLIDDNFRKQFEKARKKLGYKEVKKAQGNIRDIQTIQEAIINGKVLSIKYAPAYLDKENMKCRTAPYGIAWDNDKGYLIGKDLNEDRIINYRLDRIDSLKTTDEEHEFPNNFNLDEYIAKCWKMFFGKSVEVDVKFNKYLLPLVKDKFNHKYYDILEENDDYFIISTEVRGIHMFKNWLMSLGNQVEVLQPESLKNDIIESAKKIIKIYE
ncbi:MAG: helix-turn-helix transcriptional regulator [Candidatus Woesearchaeota archaeon]